MILKVHPSNYRIEGFHEEVSAAELSALAHEHGLLLYEDQARALCLQMRCSSMLGRSPRPPRFAPALTSSRARATSCSAPRKRALFSVAPGNRRLCLASAYARASPRQAHARGARGHFAPVCDRIRYSASGDPGAQHAFRRAAPLERQAKRCMTACCASFASLSVRRRWSCRLSRACLLRAAVRCDRRAPNFLRCRLSRRWASIRRWPKARYGTGARYAGCDARAARPGAF